MMAPTAFAPQVAKLMHRLKHLGGLGVALLLLSSCKKGELRSFPSEAPLSVSSEQTLDYTATSIRLRLKGATKISGAHPFNLLQFFSDRDCVSNIGQGLVRDFSDPGIQIVVPHNAGSGQVYVSTNTREECWLHRDYSFNLAPSQPVLNFTAPASPTRESNMPALFGVVFPRSSVVRFFSDDQCSVTLGSGSGESYLGTGVQVTLPTDSTTQIYGVTEDLLGSRSNCVLLTSFKHSSLGALNPDFGSVFPLSPTNVTTMPLLSGSVDPSVETVTLYNDPACSSQIGEGSGTDFSGSGIQAMVAPNASTTIYAKAVDENGDPSACVFLTNYTHDSVPPAPPAFVSENPTTPTRLTIHPRVRGTASSDTTQIGFYRNSICTQQIGTSNRTDFLGVGGLATVTANNTTAIYAASFDAAGNRSSCHFMLDYKHNTIPPEPPIYGGSTPLSPTNQTITPLVYGASSLYTIGLELFSDESCAVSIGAGTAEDYDGAGIVIAATENATTSVYSRVTDLEGNWSDCTFLANYAHSNLPAPNPGFVSTFPVSPTRLSNQPYITGSAATTISTVRLYTDSACSVVQGSGTRIQFVTSGVQVTLPTNATTEVYAEATDVYGNDSACVLLTTFIHNTVPPEAPIFAETIPVSPNNVTASPVIRGTAFMNPGSQLSPSQVIFYDSPACISVLGIGTPGDFAGSGIPLTLPENSISTIYARSWDAAQNGSGCTQMTSYTYNNLKPGKPLFVAANPTSPSFTPATAIRGVFGASADFMSVASVGFYSDPLCLSTLVSGAPSAFIGAGLTVGTPLNSTTTIYGQSVNEVGTLSDCQFLMNFRHYDLPPTNLQASQNLDGSLNLSWLADLVSKPTPSYTIKRATSATGPFTLIESGINGTSTRDLTISDQTTYYYKVMASNSKGKSQDSVATIVTTAAPPPTAVATLTAKASFAQVTLSWGGFSTNMVYRILRSTQSGGPYTELPNIVTASTFIDTGLTNGTLYYYVVVGSNPSGDAQKSNEVSAKPLTIPDAPLDLRLRPVLELTECDGSRGLIVTFTPPKYFDELRILRAGQALASVSTGRYVDCSLEGTGDQNWPHSVSGVWGPMEGASSNTAWFQHTGGDHNLTVDAGDGLVNLSWALSTPSDRVSVFKSQNPNGPFTLLEANVTTGGLTDTAVANGQGYYYYIQAFEGTSLPGSGVRPAGWPTAVSSARPAPNPSAPSDLRLAPGLVGEPILTWSRPSHFNRFRIYRSGSGPAGPYDFIGQTSETTFPDGAAPTGLSHYRVTAQWGSHETAPSNVVAYRVGTPTNVVLTPSASAIGVSWSAVSGAMDYQILRSTSPLGPFAVLHTLVGTSHTDSLVEDSEGYYYRLLARFSDGTQSQPSAVVAAKTTGALYPTGLTAVEVSANSVALQWIKPNGSGQQRIQRAVNVDGPYTQIAQTTSSSYFGVGLNAGQQYFFRVAAVTSGVERISAPIEIRTYDTPLTPSVISSDSAVLLSWNPVTNATNYNIERSTDGSNFIIVASGIPTYSFEDTGLTNGTRYFYRLTAVFDHGSTVSPVTAGVVPGLPLLSPEGLSLVGNFGDNVSLSWAKVPGASSYRVFLATNAEGPWTTPNLVSVAFNNVPVFSLLADTTYFVKVAAANGSFQSALSNTLVFTTATSPLAPLAVASEPAAIDLTWESVPLAATYDLERTINRVDFEVIASGLTSTSYTDASVAATTTYSYRFLPRGALGEPLAYSLVSSPVSTGIEPLAPPILMLSATSDTAVDLRWSSAPNVEGYEIRRSATSGGPYTFLASTVALSLEFQDTEVTSGQSYFYVVLSRNASGVFSPPSNEVGISLSSPVSGLVLNNTAGSVEASWTSLAGAITYQVLRSEQSGGPYATVGNPSIASFSDTTVLTDTTYYYAIRAVFSDGTVSPRSPESVIFRGGNLNLVVPIDMLDRGLASLDSGPQTFERSKTVFSTQDFNGTTVNYRLEAIIQNNDSVSRSVQLLDATDSVLADLNVPAGTTSPTRFEVGFTPTLDPNVVRLKLSSTTQPNDLQVHMARILVSQTNATQTRLYFPLLSSSAVPSAEDEGGFVGETSSTTYGPLSGVLPYVRRASNLNRIADYNAWRIDTLFSTTGTAIGELRFENATTGAAVAQTTSEFETGGPIAFGSIPIDEGATNFGAPNEGQQYRIAARCLANCTGQAIRLLKAQLSVKLEKLTLAEVHFRNTLGHLGLSIPVSLAGTRSRVESSQFSSFQAYLQATARGTNSEASASVALAETASADSGTGGLTSVTGSSLSFVGDFESTIRTPSPIALPDGYRFVTTVYPATGSLDLIGTTIILVVDP